MCAILPLIVYIPFMLNPVFLKMCKIVKN